MKNKIRSCILVTTFLMIINTKLVFSDINTISASLLVKFDGNAVKKYVVYAFISIRKPK